MSDALFLVSDILFLPYQEISATTMFSPSTSWYRSSSPHWHYFTTTGKLNWALLSALLPLCFFNWPPHFVAGTQHPCSSETPSATLQGWPLLLSASWGTSVKQCCCSSSRKWLTLSSHFLNFFISYPVHDTASPGNSILIRPSARLHFPYVSRFL